MRGLNVAKWISLIVGILLIIGSVLNVLDPISANFSLVKTLSFLLIGIGILRVVRYFSDSIFNSGAFLVGGILDIILGVIMLNNLQVSVLAVQHLVSFWILFNGIAEIAVSIDLRKVGLKRWWTALLSGILGIVLGYLLITTDGLSTLYVSMMVSIYMFTLGLTFISTFFAISRFRRMF